MKYKLNQIPVNVKIGVNEDEKLRRQVLKITVKWKYSTGEEIQNDNIDDVVSYSDVYDVVKQTENNPHTELIEKFHQDLYTKLQKQFPQIKDLKIIIEKFPFPDASIIIK